MKAYYHLFLCVCLPTTSAVCVCCCLHICSFLCVSVLWFVYMVGFFFFFLVWICSEETHKRLRNAVILVDVNDRAVSLCGQTDSRSPTRAVRLMTEIPLQASQCQTTGDPSLCVRVCVVVRVTNCQIYNHEFFTKSNSGPGKPQGRDASWESPWLNLDRLLFNIPSSKNKVRILLSTFFWSSQ